MTLPQIGLPENYEPQSDALRDRVILITGAGQGVGKTAAIHCARRGATVVLHGRNVQKLEAVYDQIEAAGLPQPAILPLDFSKATQADLTGLAQTIHSNLKRLDGILHGATHFSSTMPMDLHDLDMWMLHSRINMAVPAALTKACMPMLKKSPDASVVFLTESHAIAPKAYWGAFAATKSALATLIEVWQDEYELQPNIRFNLCLPGPVASPMRAQSHPGEVASQVAPIDTIGNGLVYLLGPDSREIRGKMMSLTRN